MHGADAALTVVTVIWGISFVIVKGALDDASTMLFLAARFTVAAVAAALWFRGKWREGGEASLRGGAVAGFILFIAYATQTMGLRLTSASKSAFITGLCVVMVPLLTALVYRSGPHVSEAAGAAVAAAGLILLTLPAGRMVWEKGDLLTFACAVAFAAHIVWIGHLAPRARFETVAVVQLGLTAVLCWVAAGWIEPPVWRSTTGLWAAMLFTGVFATSLAFAVQAWAQQHTSTTRAAVIFALEPVVAGVTGFLMFGERLTARGIVGAVLILAGILLAELKPIRLTRHPSK